MNVTFLRTPKGEELAVLPRAELEELVDVSAHTKALEEHRSGRDPGITAAEMRELLASATPLAFWRKKRGITLNGLAERTGLSAHDLSELETSSREGTASQWIKIARALGLSVEDVAVER